MDATPTIADPPAPLPSKAAEWAPAAYWLIPLGVALLGSLPWLWQQLSEPPPGMSFMGVAYLPWDFLAYNAFIRQVAESGALLQANPFTTEVQSDRFILVFHWLTGLLSKITGLPADASMEVMRVGLVFGFFATWWRFLRLFLPKVQDRLWAGILVGFAGGLESWIHVLFPAISQRGAGGTRFGSDTWMAFGWNFFSAAFNPLWLAGLILILVVLGAFLAPGGPRGWSGRLGTAAAFFLLFWVHPYSAVGLLAILAMRPVVLCLATRTLAWRQPVMEFLILLPAFLAIAWIVRWQMQDPVYQAASGGFFGPRDLSIFWYPLTLGAFGGLALVAARRPAPEWQERRWDLLAWFLAVVWLHTSPVINGFHFVYLLPLPLAIVAAPLAREIFAPAAGHHTKWRALALGVALFGAPIFTTITALRAASRENVVSLNTLRAVAAVRAQPPGNVLAPPLIGNLIPAFTGRRVWVGHWFLTPNYPQRAADYHNLTSNPARFAELDRLLIAQKIRTLVVPVAVAPPLRAHFGPGLRQDVSNAEWTVLTLH